jgi:hypothetical protein
MIKAQTTKRLTLDQGRRLREAFGPNTLMFECFTPEETCREVEAEGCSVLEWAEIQLQAEEIDVDRYGDENDHARLQAVREEVLHEAKAVDMELRR